MHGETEPDTAWVAGLSGRSPSAAARAVREAAENGRLYAYLDRAHRREGRSSYVEIEAPLELYALVRLLRPRHVVEVGVSSGVSSAYALAALEQNGRGTLHSVDLPSHPREGRQRSGTSSWSLPAGCSSGWAVPPGLRPRWDLRLGDKTDVIPFLARQLPGVDLVVYDVPHRENDLVREFAALDRLLSPGAVVLVDHGPSGDCCRALRGWARRRGARPLRRSGLGLYGARLGPRRPVPR